MTTTLQQTLTPATDATPAVVTIPEKELSGASWAERFPGSTSTSDLEPTFADSVNKFISAIKVAGGSVTISATYRPPERAYLMHWCWMLNKKKIKAAKIPAKTGVNIEWDHSDEKASQKAAADMVSAYGMSSLKVAPALSSRHTERKAIDMSISWSGDLTIKDANGNDVKIDTEPRTGMNEELQEVGKGYGVIKFWKGATDKPHWSTDGR
jgi:hypothetical protein